MRRISAGWTFGPTFVTSMNSMNFPDFTVEVEPSFAALLDSGDASFYLKPARQPNKTDMLRTRCRTGSRARLLRSVAIATWLRKLDPLGLITPVGNPELDPSAHGLGPDDPGVRCGLTLAESPTDRWYRQLSITKNRHSSSIGAEVMHRRSAISATVRPGSTPKARPAVFFSPQPRRTDSRSQSDWPMHRNSRAVSAHKYVGPSAFLRRWADADSTVDYFSSWPASAGFINRHRHTAHRGRLNVQNFCWASSHGSCSPSSRTFRPETDIRFQRRQAPHFSTRRVVTAAAEHSLVAGVLINHLEGASILSSSVASAYQNSSSYDNQAETKSWACWSTATRRSRVRTGHRPSPSSVGSGLLVTRRGGTFHVIVNSRSAPMAARVPTCYCTSRRLQKLLQAPILHVNGHDPEVISHRRDPARLSAAFGCDVICLDMVCYRRYGHNESDEPGFAQPRPAHRSAVVSAIALCLPVAGRAACCPESEADAMVQRKPGQSWAGLVMTSRRPRRQWSNAWRQVNGVAIAGSGDQACRCRAAYHQAGWPIWRSVCRRSLAGGPPKIGQLLQLRAP